MSTIKTRRLKPLSKLLVLLKLFKVVEGRYFIDIVNALEFIERHSALNRQKHL
jgi:hypothetical protein